MSLHVTCNTKVFSEVIYLSLQDSRDSACTYFSSGLEATSCFVEPIENVVIPPISEVTTSHASVLLIIRAAMVVRLRFISIAHRWML